MATTQRVMQETLEQAFSSDSLTTLLKIPTENSALEAWQTGIIAAIGAFLTDVKEAVAEGTVALSPVMISYVPHKSALIDSEEVAKTLHHCCSRVEFPTILCPLIGAELLQSQLAEHHYAIVLCTPQYAEQVAKEPAIRTALDTFGRTKKNALQPLLCEGGFNDTALKIVDKHYLIRTYQEVLNRDAKIDELHPLETFIDVFLKLSGRQGLGVLPDILGLKDKENSKVEIVYQRLLTSLSERQEQFTIDYRLTLALNQGIEEHPFKSFPTQWPVIKENQKPGFEPLLDDFLKDTAKISLLLCESSADVKLSNLGLSQALQARGLRVLEIDCAKYAGQASKHCIVTELQHLKLRQNTAITSEPLVILLKGYQNLGAYDNLYEQNKLSAWPKLKVLVTCRADFFANRGYLNCFLKPGSERRIEHLTVYAIPHFASVEAKTLSLQLQMPSASLVVSEETSSLLSIRRQAQQSELIDFLKTLNQGLVAENILKANPAQNPQVFISYAWEQDKTALIRQQQQLRTLADNLRAVGLRPWLDVEQMSGDIDAQMAQNIQNSDVVLVIGTPLYLKRCQQDTNVRKEYEEILVQQKSRELPVFPLHFLGNLSDALPEVLQQSPHLVDLRRIDDEHTYLEIMTHPERGLIPLLLGINKSTLYREPYQAFQDALTLLVPKHLLFTQNEALSENLDINARLAGYIDSFALINEQAPITSRFPLKGHVEAFLAKEQSKTLVVLARAGSGKSLFALELFKGYLSAWQQYRENKATRPQWVPLYLSLKQYAQNPENAIERALKEDYQLREEEIEALKQGFGCAQGVLVIADGYDELGSGAYPNLSEQLRDWPYARLILTSRPEHFDSSHPVSQVLRPLSGTLSEVFVSPFIPEEIKRYINHYEQSQTSATYETLQKLPGMMALLDNPFLLTLVLQSLPELLKNPQAQKKVLRLHVYEAFARTWFLQETKGRKLLPKDCQAFAEELAFELFKAGTLSPTESYPTLWSFFNSEAHTAVRDAAPLRYSAGQYSFVHKSMYEYFLAEYLYHALEINRNLWNSASLVSENVVINFLSERYQTLASTQTFETVLFELIEASRHNPAQGIAAANAATVLNAAGISFSNKDFSHAHLPGANLQGGVFDSTNFEGANLSKVSFKDAWLSRASFRNANLTDLYFGEKPARNHESEVWATAYSPDGTLLAVGEESGLITIYNAHTLEKVRTHTGHTDAVNALAYRPDGLELASGSNDNTLKIWDAVGTSLEPLRTHEGHTDEVRTLAYRPDGLELASGSWDQTLKIWDARGVSLIALRTYTGHTRGVNALAYRLDGLELASGSADMTLKIWDAVGTNLEPLRTHEGHTNQVRTLAYRPDGLELASGSNDNTLKIWDARGASLEPLRTHEGHTARVRTLAYRPDGLELVSGSEDKTLKIWDAVGAGLEPLRTHTGHTKRVDALACRPDGLELASGSEDKTLKIWDAVGASLEPLRTHRDGGLVTTLAYRPDGLELASGSEDKTLKIWDAVGASLEPLRIHTGHTKGVNALAYRPDGLELASGSYDNTLKIWDAVGASLEPLRTHEGHTSSVDVLAYRPDGLELASGSWDQTLKIWDAVGASLEPLRTHTGHTEFVTTLAYRPDGLELASGSEDMTLKIWDAVGASLEPLRTHTGHTEHVTTLAYRPDGLELASGSYDNTLILWRSSAEQGANEANGDLMNTLKASATTSSIAYHPNGQHLATGHTDGAILRWKMNPEKQWVLVWRSKTQALMAQDLKLEGAQIFLLNRELLEQRGAVVNPTGLEKTPLKQKLNQLEVSQASNEPREGSTSLSVTPLMFSSAGSLVTEAKTGVNLENAANQPEQKKKQNKEMELEDGSKKDSCCVIL